jgi:thioredoxin reductase (NADPH)
MFGSNVTRLMEGLAEIERQGRSIQIRNDAVIVCAGGILPTPFLKSMGIEVETKYGTR